MTIKHEKKYQQFSIDLGDGEEAELAYATPEDTVLNFTHTYVPESFRGKGVADKLITEGLQYAEKNNLKIIASCSAVQAFLAKHPEFEHLRN